MGKKKEKYMIKGNSSKKIDKRIEYYYFLKKIIRYHNFYIIE